jgi:hypothetical protein
MTILNVWVENQPEGAPYNQTGHYIEAAGYSPIAGVDYNPDAYTLAGEDAELVFAEFLRLAAAVKLAGHGEGMADLDETDPPRLTACPVELIKEKWRSAAESLARLTSKTAHSFANWRAEVPSMRAQG